MVPHAPVMAPAMHVHMAPPALDTANYPAMAPAPRPVMAPVPWAGVLRPPMAPPAGPWTMRPASVWGAGPPPGVMAAPRPILVVPPYQPAMRVPDAPLLAVLPMPPQPRSLERMTDALVSEPLAAEPPAVLEVAAEEQKEEPTYQPLVGVAAAAVQEQERGTTEAAVVPGVTSAEHPIEQVAATPAQQVEQQQQQEQGEQLEMATPAVASTEPAMEPEVAEQAAAEVTPAELAVRAEVPTATAAEQPAAEAPAAAPPSAPSGPISWADRARAASVSPASLTRAVQRPPQRLPGAAQPNSPRYSRQQQQPHGHREIASYGGGRGRGRSRDGSSYHEGRGHGRSSYASGRGRSGYQHAEDARSQLLHRRSPTTQPSGSGYSGSGSHQASVPSGLRTPPAKPTPHPPSPGSVYPAGLVHQGPGSSSPVESANASAGNGRDAAPTEPPPLLLGDPLAPLAALCCGGRLPAGSSLRLQPRGIINPGHYCFANSIVQALMGSSSFCNVMATLGSAPSGMLGPSLPTLSVLAALHAEFTPVKPSLAAAGEEASSSSSAGGAGSRPARDHGPGMLGGAPLSPALLADVVNRFRPAHASGLPPGLANGADVHLREQEDAHDFLEYLLDRMHAELLQLGRTHGWAALQPRAAPSSGDTAAASSSAEDDGWLVQSGRRAAKRQEHRGADDAETAISAIFRGRLLSTVTCAGQKPSETSQPFLALELHILPDNVRGGVWVGLACVHVCRAVGRQRPQVEGPQCGPPCRPSPTDAPRRWRRPCLMSHLLFC